VGNLYRELAEIAPSLDNASPALGEDLSQSTWVQGGMRDPRFLYNSMARFNDQWRCFVRSLVVRSRKLPTV
jgi:hypothetical protein